MSFESAEQVANAVLYEGYLLYPYRASALKNRLRWQFGVLAPRWYAEAADGDPWFAQTECLVEVGVEVGADAARDATIDIRVRCLQVEGDEGVERSVETCGIGLEGLLSADYEHPIRLPRGDDGPIEGRIRATAERVDGFVRLRVRIENVTGRAASAAVRREDILGSALVGTHAVLVVRGGRFLSMVDVPPAASAAVASCANLHAWPVLVGDPLRRDTMLSSPIILSDFPVIAPESPGALFDGTEIDEILALRILTLTDAEKRAARATDPRAAAIVNRVDAMGPGEFDALHGTWRELLNPTGEAPPEEATVDVAGVTVGRGSRVVVRPRRRSDPMDLFLAGRVARVQAVHRDLDGRVHVAVVVDDDPAGDLHAEFGRFFYYGPEELEPVE